MGSEMTRSGGMYMYWLADGRDRGNDISAGPDYSIP